MGLDEFYDRLTERLQHAEDSRQWWRDDLTYYEIRKQELEDKLRMCEDRIDLAKDQIAGWTEKIEYINKKIEKIKSGYYR